MDISNWYGWPYEDERSKPNHMEASNLSTAVMNKFRILTKLLIIMLSIESMMAMSPETMAKLDAALGNWKTITPDMLTRPDNADLLLEMQSLAKDQHYTSARVPLIKLGDEKVIQSCLKLYRIENANSRRSAMSQLGLAANPKIIPLIAGDLKREEDWSMIYFGDNGMLPLSMAAASIIKTIILENPAFPENVKEWARRLPKYSGELRDGIRDWWKLNQSVIQCGDYQSVIPGKEVALPLPKPQDLIPEPVVSPTAEPIVPSSKSMPGAAR